MADNKLHILLIDDDINTEVDFAAVRKNLPDAEIALVKKTSQAITQLDKWRVDGVSADMIVSDLGFFGDKLEDDYGFQVLAKIDQWLQSTDANQNPRFYLQSKDYKELCEGGLEDNVPGRICIPISSYEWDDIANGELTGVATRKHSNILREHIAELLVQKNTVSAADWGNHFWQAAQKIIYDTYPIRDRDSRRLVDTGLMKSDKLISALTNKKDWSGMSAAKFIDMESLLLAGKRTNWPIDVSEEYEAETRHAAKRLFLCVRQSLKEQSIALPDNQAAYAFVNNVPSIIDGTHGNGSPFRILIVDDDITGGIEFRKLFKNTPANVEVEIAYSGRAARQIMEMYAESGKYFDMVDVDYHLGTQAHTEIRSGLPTLQMLMEICEAWPELVRPKQFSLHSKDSLEEVISKHAPELIGKILIFNPTEWEDISAHGDNYESCDRLEGRTTVLREYFNRTLDTNFPLSTIEMQLLQTPDDKLEVWIAYRAVKDGLLTKETGLARLKLDPDLIERLSPHIDSEWARENEIHDDFFCDSEGPDVVGKAVFNETQISALCERQQTPILFLDTFEPSQTGLLSRVGGVVLLDKASGHLKPLAANHGIKAVMDKGDRYFIENDESGDPSYVVKDYEEKKIYRRLKFGDDVTLGGQHVYHGKVPFLEFNGAGLYGDIIEWQKEVLADKSVLATKANADTPAQVRKAIDLGADGVGLLRTEHMFFADGRLNILQTALLTDDIAERDAAFVKLKGFQKTDFAEILSAAATTERSFPVTIRLLDAPPEEFMNAEQVQAFTQKVGQESTRGVQLAERIPGLYAMQAEAVLEAAKETGFNGQLDIMIPLVRTVEEFRAAKQEVTAAAEKTGMTSKYQIRAMIETLDAVRSAAEIAQEADGLSFGTNDLTSESMGGVARNDIVATREWMARLDVNHIGKSPFLRLSEPVKHLMEETVTKARAVNPGIDIGICGHQVAGDAGSIEFCHTLGLNSISVPASPEYLIASRIIAGQAALNYPNTKVFPTPAL